MQVGWVKLGDFRQITRHNSKTSTAEALSTEFGLTFITLSVHLCLQHVFRDAARHAGSSATAGTCCLGVIQ